MVREYDVCIVGGGPSGSILAMRLARLGHSVLLVERSRFPRRHLGESLTPGVVPLLESVGAHGVIEASGGRSVRRVRVLWDRESQVREDPREQGRIVDRALLDTALLRQARSEGVRVIQPGTLSSRRWAGDAWQVRITAGEREISVRARFLADASGRARALGGSRRMTGQPTLALYAYWRGAGLPTEPRMEAGDDAWYWGVPLPDGSYNTLVFVDRERFRAGSRTPAPRRFLQWIHRSGLMDECPGARMSGAVRAIDATAYLADTLVTARSIRVGDAAMAIDPLSSSGVQKAIQSALSGAIVVNTLLRRPEDRDAAIRFYQESMKSASDRHRAWAGHHYASASAQRTDPFWKNRAAVDIAGREPSEPRPLPDPECLLSPSSELSFEPQPVLGEEFVRIRTAVRHPEWDGPVAYLGGYELAPLLCEIPAVLRARDVSDWCASRVGPESARTVASWLMTRGALVPARSTVPIR